MQLVMPDEHLKVLKNLNGFLKSQSVPRDIDPVLGRTPDKGAVNNIVKHEYTEYMANMPYKKMYKWKTWITA